MACILYLGNINKAIDVIIKFVALASIAKVDDFYASALPADGNKIKRKTSPLVITVHKRDWARAAREQREVVAAGSAVEDFVDGSAPAIAGKLDSQEYLVAGINHRVGRLIFKTLRMIYGCFIFYFMPYASIFIPFMATSMRVAPHSE